MGQLYGSLRVSKYTAKGDQPVADDAICFTNLNEPNLGASVSFKACALNERHDVSYDGNPYGYYYGCPDSIKGLRDPPKLSAPGKGHHPSGPSGPSEAPVVPPPIHFHPDEVTGWCIRIPLRVSTTIFRGIVITIVTIIIGYIFVSSLMTFYNHSDSTNTNIFPT